MIYFREQNCTLDITIIRKSVFSTSILGRPKFFFHWLAAFQTKINVDNLSRLNQQQPKDSLEINISLQFKINISKLVENGKKVELFLTDKLTS